MSLVRVRRGRSLRCGVGTGSTGRVLRILVRVIWWPGVGMGIIVGILCAVWLWVRRCRVRVSGVFIAVVCGMAAMRCGGVLMGRGLMRSGSVRG